MKRDNDYVLLGDEKTKLDILLRCGDTIPGLAVSGMRGPFLQLTLQVRLMS